ncbi:MAG: DNA alkylation repair protein, partial [Actinobacteria bacterium]|nr:DNA alkylation repair protein [Actinomycetota bacterium]
VDVSAPTIGAHLLDMRGARTFLQSMAEDENLWIRRTSILFTFASLKIGDRKPTLTICTKLLGDDHDLIHKAVGWALREVGKLSSSELRAYLEKYGRKMSRTTLRYAIEKFSISERKQWLERTR